MKWELVFLATIFATSIFAATTNALQISEVMYNPNGTDTGREWIEIYTDTPFNATGLMVFDNNGNHNTNLIQGDEVFTGYAIITNNAANFLIAHDYYGTLFQSSISLPNAAGVIGLKKGQEIFENTTYDSSWGGNGNGRTLEKFEELWIESENIGGTPGYGYQEQHQVPEFTALGVMVALVGVLSALAFARKK